MVNGPLRKDIKSYETPCMIMVGLSGTLTDLENALDMAYQDVLNDTDLTWGGSNVLL